ncbi:Sodium/hydrogen exchanger family-domain-containing protein [Crassisporium funariophilum]|nr:Sodium/hydrogen exchanger family-domain-containing protein [Crassisporium funariophilum]
MVFYPFEITTPHVIYALLGGFIVLFGMFSLFLRERLYIGEAIWAFLFGIIIGPYCANIFNPRAWSGDSDEVTNVITLEFTRVVLAIGVFAIGVELPKAYMAKHWKSLFYLLVPVMTWGWFVSAGLIFALIPGLNFLSSLAVAACLTPTDPILAAAVVGGKWADKHVPAHIRHLLAAESGCNDGAAFPFLFISLYLIIDAPNTGKAIQDWFLLLWLYQVILGTVIGAFLGFGFRHLMQFCQRFDLIDRHSYVAQYVSLAMLTIGVTTLLGSDDLLAAFACGTAFAWDGFFNKQTEESVFSSVIDTLFNVAAFIFVGAWMPFSHFQNAALTLEVWRLIVIAILVLLLRRLPIMIALYKFIPDVKTFREAVFSGHFGPIGIGAIFISTLATEVLHKAHMDDNPQIHLLTESIQPIVAFMVLCSITIHGLSIPSFSLGRRVHSVSRTWSRRDTIGAQPDWTNQATIITRGEDIVINRDDNVDLERGDAGRSEKRGSNHTGETEKVPGSEGSVDTKIHPDHPVKAVDYREEVNPDGDEKISEWKEGSHRIIERRLAPGDDVRTTLLVFLRYDKLTNSIL